MSQITRLKDATTGGGDVLTLGVLGNPSKVAPDSNGNIDFESTNGNATFTPVPASNKIQLTVNVNDLTWTEITATTANASVSNGYILNNGSGVNLTLPTTFALGSIIKIIGKGSGSNIVTAGGTTTISLVGPTFAGLTTSPGGTLIFQDQFGVIMLTAITADGAWVAEVTGNFTVT